MNQTLHPRPLRLGVNIDHVATLRQARYPENPFALNAEPCPLDAARDALAGGADSITLHGRRDHRHMQPADATRIRAEVPLSEMFGYATDLRSRTQGRANYTMQFDSYQQMPSNIQEEIVARLRGE